MSANAELEISDVNQFDLLQPFSQGRRLTLIRRQPSAHRIVLFVHGLKSSAETWVPFVRAAFAAPELADFDFAAFEYKSSLTGRLRFPFRKVNAEDWARVLADTIEHSLLARGHYQQVVLVGHSMGGLVCKMAVRDLAHEGNTDAIAQIHSVFTYATPHFGSDRAFAPVAMLSHDVAFLRANSKELQSLQRFWNTRVGPDQPIKIHERAVISASDEVVPVTSASGGLSQQHVFHVATSHTNIHCPDNASDRRITWFCQELSRIDRRSGTELLDIHNFPAPDTYNADNGDFFAALFKMTFVLQGGSSDAVQVGDQCQLFYELEAAPDGSPAADSASAAAWNLLEATRVEKHKTFAMLKSFSGAIAMRRADLLAAELAISPFKTPSSKQISKLVHGLFDHVAARIPRQETKASQAVTRAIDRVQAEQPGSNAWQRATHDVLEYSEQFLDEFPDSALAEGFQFDRAFALKSLGRLDEARSRFERFTQRFPFSVSTPGAHHHIEEIDYRLAASAAPDDLYSVFRLGTYLMGYGDFVEGAQIVWEKLLLHPNELDNFKANTRLELFALFVASDLLGQRFADRQDLEDWARHYRKTISLQQQAKAEIDQCDEPARGVMQALHAGLPNDIDQLG